MTNVHCIIDGTLLVSKNQTAYKRAIPFDGFPYYNPREVYDIEEFITIDDSSNIKFSGTGLIDGQGFDWWVREWQQTNILGRPKILVTRKV